MSKIRKFRVVTNREHFRVQKQRKFLGIKWWEFDKPDMLFANFSNAQQLVSNHENAERSLEEMRLSKKEELKKMRKDLWRPVEKEN